MALLSIVLTVAHGVPVKRFEVPALFGLIQGKFKVGMVTFRGSGLREREPIQNTGTTRDHPGPLENIKPFGLISLRRLLWTGSFATLDVCCLLLWWPCSIPQPKRA